MYRNYIFSFRWEFGKELENWDTGSVSDTDFVDKWIHLSVASYYDFDELGSLCAAVYSKSSYLKILEVRDWKKCVQIENFLLIQSWKFEIAHAYRILISVVIFTICYCPRCSSRGYLHVVYV